MPDTADQALSRAVVTNQDPIAPAVVANTARALKVKSVPEAEGKRKLQINNSGQTVSAIQPNGLPVPAAQNGQNQTMTAQERDARITALAGQAAQGDKSAKREMRQLQDQQRVQEKVDHAAGQEAQQQQQQRQQQKAERKAAQQQPPVQQQEQKQQHKAERKAAQQQPPVQQQQQKAERKAAQQQPPVQQQQQKQPAATCSATATAAAATEAAAKSRT